jgi:hypothetical protein
MTASRRFLACAFLACLFALVGCGKSESPAPGKTASAPAAPAPPPAPAAAAPAPPKADPNAAIKRAASEVWIYAFPLVLTDVTRETETAGGSVNTFKHTRTIPDASTAGAAHPNADFLYSQGWLDLSEGPVVLTVPDTKGRYYLLALLDAYTNVAASIGKRTTGTEKRQFAIVGPGFKGAVPEGTSEVKSPTDLAWIFGRTAVEDRGDLANAVKVQDQYKLEGPKKKAPAKAAGKRGAAPAKTAAPAKASAPPSDKSPRDQVAAMNAATYFARVAALLPENPPSKEDAPILEKMKLIGLTPGQPFDASKLDPAVQQALDEGVQEAIKAVSQAAGGLAGADIRNGWRIDRAQGRWGNDYGRRALAAWNGIGLNAPEDAIFMSTDLGGGKKLDGANRYVLHFDAHQLPPTDGFWSVSLYDENQRFVANPANRYNIGSTDKLKTNADGSLDIAISQANPGGDANWLPAPKGPFSVILRVYWPKQELIDGRWNPPAIRLAAS